MSSDEPKDFLDAEIAKLKADLVRFVLFEAHRAGRDDADAELARTIAIKIGDAVEGALKRSLNKPDNPIAEQLAAADKALRKWRDLAMLSAEELGEIKGQIVDARTEIGKLTKAVEQLADKAGQPIDKTNKRPPVVNPAPREPWSPRALLSNLWPGSFVKKIAAVALVLAAVLGILYWQGLTPFRPAETASPPGLSLAQSEAVGNALEDAFQELDSLRAQLDENLDPRASLATAGLAQEPRRRIAANLTNAVSKLTILRQQLADPSIRAGIDRLGARPEYNGYSVTHVRDIPILTSAQAVMQEPEPEAPAPGAPPRGQNQSRNAGPTIAQLRESIGNLLDAVTALSDKLRDTSS